MTTIKSTFLSNKIARIIFVVFAFLLFYLVSYLIDPYDKFWVDYFDQDILKLTGEWIVSFLFCYLISEFSILIHSKLNNKVTWTEQPGKRLFLEATLNIIVVLVIIFLNVLSLYFIYGDPTALPAELSTEEKKGLIQWITVSLIIAFMIIGVNTGNYLINNWITTEMQITEHKLKAAKLKQASVEAELTALKLQLDPHFIFNNLSVLSELILENQQLGYEFSENFSKVYRFLLVNSKKNLIPLEDELKFLNSYIFLILQRIGDGVHFEIDVDNDSQNLYLPPLTLQLLIENALKHNKTSKSNPLVIKIQSIDQTTLLVENTLYPIEKQQEYSTGIGLTNIIRRFNLLSKMPPVIIKDAESFKVIIHLTEYDQ